MTDSLTCIGCATQRYSCEHDAETEIARGVAELAESAERLVGLAKIFRADDDTLCLVHAVLTALGDYNHSRRVQ